MLPFAYYLLKVLICSGLLFGYYWFALRNKRFHNYNRFYLLAAIVLSWIIPLLKLDFWNESDQNPEIIKLLTVVSGGDRYVEQTVVNAPFNWHWNAVASIAFILVSFIFLIIFLATLYRILKLIRSSRKETLNDIYFIFSDARGTPFTFFRYIFWNNKIDINAEAGKSILRHELVHVNEKHSADKLFINVVLIAGWYNPFFLLIRKELNMLHEFIADQKAFAGGDASAFALMILNASYANHSGTLTQSFFHSPIKRRLLMLTKSRHPHYSYLRRVMVLPLVFFVFVFFAFRLKENRKSSLETGNGNNVKEFSDTTKAKDRKQLTVIAYGDTSKNKGLLSLTLLDDGTTITQQAKKDSAVYSMQADVVVVGGLGKIVMDSTKKSPMYLYDGKLITEEGFKRLNIQPENIKSINVYKGASANQKFGEKGINGVVEVFVKQKQGVDLNEVRADDPSYSHSEKLKAESIKQGNKDPNKEVVVIGYRTRADVTEVPVPKPLYFYNDKLMSEEEFTKLNIEAGKIKAINVYKGVKAIEKFGPTAVNGVVEVSVAQEPLIEVRDVALEKVFTRAENPPYYENGMTAFGDYFDTHVQYPAKALENKIEGSVSIQFIVDENGKLSNFKKLSNKGYGLEEEAIRLLKNSGDWKPAIQNGHKVAYQVQQLIVFVLPGKQAL